MRTMVTRGVAAIAFSVGALGVAGLASAGAQAPAPALAVGDSLHDPDPFPLGACVTVARYSDEPVCVIVDPDDR